MSCSCSLMLYIEHGTFSFISSNMDSWKAAVSGRKYENKVEKHEVRLDSALNVVNELKSTVTRRIFNFFLLD